VRAAMVDDPANYRWTSYRANALGQADSLLKPHPLYLSLGTTDKARQTALPVTVWVANRRRGDRRASHGD
jgi:hypothetical protein